VLRSLLVFLALSCLPLSLDCSASPSFGWCVSGLAAVHHLTPTMSSRPLIPPAKKRRIQAQRSEEQQQRREPADVVLVCAVCQHQPHQPLETQCGHRFCSRCITDMLGHVSLWPAACPVCRSPIHNLSDLVPISHTSTSTSTSTSSASNSKSMECTNHERGCSWVGEATHGLAEHLASSCHHHPCPNSASSGCRWVGSIGEALLHQATECDASHSSSSSTSSSSSSSSGSGWSDKMARAVLSSRVYSIDVGDRTFRASEQTLRRESGSVLDRLFSGDFALPRGSYHRGFSQLPPGHRDEADTEQDGSAEDRPEQERAQERGGRLFIDCDAQSFEHVLHWLRSYVSVSLSLSLMLLPRLLNTQWWWLWWW